ncbi:MAG TPA: methyltransferase domain-containing protein [Dongiaceae bacterium]|nr:methyltransferase domain-containing protein [Dongiaceae bacterium]
MDQGNTRDLRSNFHAEVAGLLRCIDCGHALETDGAKGYGCPGCGKKYPERSGVASFVDSGAYADSFGFQWHRYNRTQLDNEQCRESELHFRQRTGFRPEELKGKLVLDVGCGMGRFAEVATRWGARVVGIDLSAAAQVAARNLGDRDFVALQADVFALPFAPESFDYIYSIGVLHHTPDCEAAVKTLPKFLKPGGHLAVWLYSGYNKWYRFSDFYRRFTNRMPPRLLHGVLSIVVPTLNALDTGLRIVPVVGKPLAGVVHHVFPVNRNPRREFRVLDTFDWYSPRYQSKHTYEQVFRWFESCGMEDLHVVEVPIAVRGRKPERAHEGLHELVTEETRVLA